ncbi:DUF6785 family protein [Candidatus Poribacteria bacterium]
MITARSVIITFILIALLSTWTIYSEHFVGSINSISPPPGAIFLFFFVVLTNSLLKSRKFRLREPELIVIYSLLLVSAPMSSFALSRFMIAILVAPFYFATPENEFESLFHGAIPEWFAPRTPNIVKGFYEPMGRGVPWEEWLKPLTMWIFVALAAYMLMLFMSVIIHRQWIERERLTFPTVYLPLRLAEKPDRGSFLNPLLKNKFLWIGLAIPLVLHGINGLSLYFPVLPRIPLKNEISRYLTDSPWNAIDQLPAIFYPNVVGFAYLLPVDISFSCWFFYLLSKVGMIAGAAFGLRTKSASGALFPLPHYQSAGAFISLLVFNLWFGRRYLFSVLRGVFERGGSTNSTIGGEDDPELMKLYRIAVIGFLVVLSILALLFAYMELKPIVIAGFIALLLVYSLSAGRARTAAGLGAVSGPIRMDDFLQSTIGTRRIGTGNLTILSYMRWITIDLRGFMSAVPAQLESFKMTGRNTKTLKRMPILILCSVAFALIISCTSLLWLSYEKGVYTSGVNSWWIVEGPRETFDILRHNVLNLRGTDWVGVQFTSLGFVVAGIIAYLRTKFLWFPFHPLGYAVGFSRLSMDWVWFSILIGWGLKLGILKYGGLKLNRIAVPCFLGLILGDFFMAGFWGILGSIGGQVVYQVFP